MTEHVDPYRKWVLQSQVRKDEVGKQYTQLCKRLASKTERDLLAVQSWYNDTFNLRDGEGSLAKWVSDVVRDSKTDDSLYSIVIVGISLSISVLAGSSS